MRPAQFVTQCVTIWEGQVKLAHIFQVGNRKSLSKVPRHASGQVVQQPGAVLGTVCAALLTDDGPADLPVCLHHRIIGGLVDLASRRGQNGLDFFVKGVVHGFPPARLWSVGVRCLLV